MSYGVAAALQQAVYQHLVQDATLMALVGGAIFDAVPPGTAPGTFVLLGPEEVRDLSDVSGGGAEHSFTGERDQRRGPWEPRTARTF
jgi:hypothetical protein